MEWVLGGYWVHVPGRVGAGASSGRSSTAPTGPRGPRTSTPSGHGYADTSLMHKHETHTYLKQRTRIQGRSRDNIKSES